MNGFLMNIGNKDLFLISEKKNITDDIARAFINKICDIRNKPVELKERALNDKPTLNDFKRRIDKATLEHKKTQNGYEYDSVVSKNFMLSIPNEEKDSLIIF